MRFTTAVSSALLSVIARAASSDFTYYKLPTLSGPCDLCTGPDGNIWSSNILDNTISKVDVNTGAITTYEIPYSALPPLYNASLPVAGRLSFACAIRPGRDGNLYAATGIRSQFLKINPSNGNMQIFTPPPPNVPFLGNIQPFNDIWSDDTGVWYTLTTANALYHFNFNTQTFDTYVVPTPLAGPLGTFVASDGNVWVCESQANKIARFNPRTKVWTEIPLPLNALGPVVVRVETKDATSRYVWFTCVVGNSLGRVNIDTLEVKIFQDPIPASLPSEDTVDGDGFVWYSTATRNTLNKLDPATGNIQIIPQPETPPTPPAFDVAINYGPGNAIWFAQIDTDRIGKYQL